MPLTRGFWPDAASGLKRNELSSQPLHSGSEDPEMEIPYGIDFQPRRPPHRWFQPRDDCVSRFRQKAISLFWQGLVVAVMPPHSPARPLLANVTAGTHLRTARIMKGKQRDPENRKR